MAKKITKKDSAVLPSVLTVTSSTKSSTASAQKHATAKALPPTDVQTPAATKSKRAKPVTVPAGTASIATQPTRNTAPVVPAVTSTRVSQTAAVRLAIYDPTAKQVCVCGAFNDWAPAPMTRQADGEWETTVDLAPGRYEYKFLVDGQWAPDPRARENVMNEFGTLNSVIDVKA